MRVSYLFGSVLLVVAGLLHAAAQDGGCALNTDQSPQLRGLRLGMTTAQVGATYPRLPLLQADEFSQVRATFADLKAVDEAAFAGVSGINLNFIDGRLVEFAVHYDGGPWDNMDQFLAKFRESLKLPGGWAGEDYDTRRLSCDKFQIEVGASSYSVGWIALYVRLKELGAEDVVAGRVAEKRARQRQAFKP